MATHKELADLAFRLNDRLITALQTGSQKAIDEGFFEVRFGSGSPLFNYDMELGGTRITYTFIERRNGYQPINVRPLDLSTYEEMEVSGP